MEEIERVSEQGNSVQKKRNEMVLPDQMQDFIRDVEQTKSSGTAKTYSHCLLWFLNWWKHNVGETFDAVAITSVDLKEYQRYLEEQGLKPATINLRMRAIASFLQWALDVGLIERIPRFPKTISEQKRPPQALERAEVNRLLRELEKEGKARDIAFVRLLLSCGLRISEVVQLRVEDVKMSERKGTVTVRYGKGNKWRVVPIPAQTREAIQTWLSVKPESPWLFPSQKNSLKPIDQTQGWRIVTKYAQRAGLTFHPHTLRHTFAYTLLRSGADLVSVAELLGHSSLETTKIYTRPKMEDLERFVEQAEH